MTEEKEDLNSKVLLDQINTLSYKNCLFKKFKTENNFSSTKRLYFVIKCDKILDLSEVAKFLINKKIAG